MQNTTLPLQELQKRFAQVAVRLPIIAGEVAVNFALDNFKRQSFLGPSLQPWRPRKSINKWKQKQKNNGRNILMQTGTLRRSIRILRADYQQVVIGSDVPYAKAHNEGSRLGVIQQVRDHTRKTISKKVAIVKTVSVKSKTNITFGKYQTGEHTVKAYKRRINQNLPKRQFIGNSPYLNAAISRAAGAAILKELR